MIKSAHLAAWIALGMPALAAPQEDLALDGARSLGQQAPLSEILRLFRQPSEEDEAFLAGLAALGNQMLVLEATTESLYRERGLFEVFPERAEVGLVDFHAAVREFLDDPEPRLLARGAEAEVWARIFYDVRLHMRAELFEGWRQDAEDVDDGLALLRANTDGWVRTEEAEAQLIAKRVDLAAALLRARIKDLSALREEHDAPSEVLDEDVERLLEMMSIDVVAERQALLDEEYARVDRDRRRMRGVLFSSRLRIDAHNWITWRADMLGKAARMRAEVRTLQPQTEEGKDAPREIRIQKKTTRRREAFARAIEGLSYDPFDDELAYAAGLMAEYVSGVLESLNFYDRFLALRSIRVYRDQQWPDDLTEEEEHAIFQIQQYEKRVRGGDPIQKPGVGPGPGSGSGPGGGPGGDGAGGGGSGA